MNESSILEICWEFLENSCRKYASETRSMSRGSRVSLEAQRAGVKRLQHREAQGEDPELYS